MADKTDAWMPLWIGANGKTMNWAVLDPMSPDQWPCVAGVYAIYFDERIVYIGQSTNLCARMTRHSLKYGYARNIHTPWGEIPDSVKVTAKVKRSRVIGDWAMWEIRLINRLKPLGNSTYKKRYA